MDKIRSVSKWSIVSLRAEVKLMICQSMWRWTSWVKRDMIEKGNGESGSKLKLRQIEDHIAVKRIKGC